MAASKAQFNVSAVAFTVGGTPTVITRVTNLTYDSGASLKPLAADNDRYPRFFVNDMNNPTVTVTSFDIATMQSIPPGTSGSLAATHNDALAATGGGIVYAFANAVLQGTPSQAPFGDYGSVTGTWMLFSADGSTNPVSFTRV